MEQSVERAEASLQDDQVPVRPSEPHLDDQASRRTPAEVPSDRSAPVVYVGGNQDFQALRNNQMFQQ